MEKWTVLSLPKKLLRPYKHAAIRMAKRLLPQKKQLLFLFGGRTQHWPGMGSELYRHEPVFRDSINQCDEIFYQLTGTSILPNFEGPPDEKFFEDETFIVFTISAVQVAMSDLWRSKGIRPNAVMGVSLGDVTAVYAAGGMTLKDTMKAIVDCAAIHKLEDDQYVPLYLQTGLAAAQELSRNSPAFLAPIYEAGGQAMLTLCHQDDKLTIGEFLDSKSLAWNIPHTQTIWPYHTHRIQKHRDELTRYSNSIEPLPLQVDFYSSVLGKVIPAGSIIDNNYWFELKHKPVLLHSALMATARAEGMEIMVNAGPHALAKGQVMRSTGNRSIEVLDSMRRDANEMALLNDVRSKLAAYKFHTATNGNGDPVQHFIQHFSLYHPDYLQQPDPYLSFLKRHGNTHFLPAHNTWIVQDYDDIEHALKNPQLFSSSLHKTFDECLVGADPPAHTAVRALLQPLFSPQMFADLATFTTQYAEKLLDGLISRRQFNVVDEFSLPLAQAVVARMLGLTESEAQALQKNITGHVYAMGHLDALYIFFKKHLEEQRSHSGNAASLLLSFVKDGTITEDAAIKLLRLLWVAGMTTTSMLISMTIYMAAKDKSLAVRLQENDQLTGRFIEECLRLEAPESELKRITTTDVRLGNTMIPAGSVVMLMLRTANRDPKHFERPEEIILDRPHKKHLSFGGGYHYCLGVGMARLEAKHALKAVLEKMPGLALDETKPVTWFPSPHFRGLGELMCKCIDEPIA